jgi:hypothetical protein
MSVPVPKDGWYDSFNGIRTPAVGVCSSFEELVSEVLKTKIALGIFIGSQKEEEDGIIDRLCTSGRINCKRKSGCC